MKSIKNASFLQAVIYIAAEDAYQQEVIDAGIEGDIGPGEEYESKEDWIHDRINIWFEATGQKIKPFKHTQPEIMIDEETENAARGYYNCPLGHSFKTKEGSVEVYRVPGGWIQTETCNGVSSSCFVPFSEEFKHFIGVQNAEGRKESTDKNTE